MLSITGAEAMYADLGHFSQRSIMLSFLFFVYPCLLFTYMGQVGSSFLVCVYPCPLFTDMGQVGSSFLVCVYPCLLFTDMGQVGTKGVSHAWVTHLLLHEPCMDYPSPAPS